MSDQKMKNMKGLFFAFVLFPLLAHSQGQMLQRKIEGLLEKENTREALQLAQNALKNNPSDPAVLHSMGKIYFNSRNFKVAEVFLAQAIERSENTGDDLFFDMGQTLQMGHQFEEAIQEYEKIGNKFSSTKGVKAKIAQCKAGIDLISKPVDVKITNLGKIINSASHEFHPLLSGDEVQMVFNRNSSVKFNPFKPNSCQIFQSFNKGHWEKPNPLPKPVQSEAGEIATYLSVEGNQIAIQRRQKSEDLFISDFRDGKWSKAKPMAINSPKSESSMCFSPNGNHLYFVSDRRGKKDIYLCQKLPNGNWSKPKLLGQNVNTAEDEECPWVDSEGNYLYFSSRGHNSMGGYDVFKLDLKNPEAKPENIGYPINSTSDDLFFQITPEGKSAYYSSEREGGFGGSDIYQVQFGGSKTKQIVLFKGTISDLSGQPIDAQVVISDVATREVVARIKAHPETGTLVTRLQNGKSYSILVEKEGYLFHSDFINLEDEKSPSDVIREIAMQKLQPGVTLILGNIFFDLGKSSLKKESSQELQRILMILRQNPGLVAEISAHLDPGGPEDNGNLKLSEYRAQAIVDYLVATGIKSTRLIAKGYGTTKPLPDNQNAKSGGLNRRCELKILSTQ
jgi:outer membrane protein OmpA-like peptidoglycan-associated protein